MKKYMILPFIAIFFWSTVSVISKLLLQTYNNFQLLWISSLFAGLFLFVVNICNGNLKLLKTYKVKDFVTTILIGIPGTFLYYVFYYAGADILPASQAFIVNYTWPIMSIIFACIILREKMTIWKAAAILISFFGIIIVMGEDLTNFNSLLLVGGVFCILGAMSYGSFTALNKKFHYNKSLSMMLNYFTTFIITTIINALSHRLFVPTPLEVVGFAWNGMLTMALSTTIWAIALEKGDTAKISNLAYITPFLSLLWTSLFLKEELNGNFVIGLIVIIFGVFLQFKKSKKEN